MVVKETAVASIVISSLLVPNTQRQLLGMESEASKTWSVYYAVNALWLSSRVFQRVKSCQWEMLLELREQSVRVSR